MKKRDVSQDQFPAFQSFFVYCMAYRRRKNLLQRCLSNSFFVIFMAELGETFCRIAHICENSKPFTSNVHIAALYHTGLRRDRDVRLAFALRQVSRRSGIIHDTLYITDTRASGLHTHIYARASYRFWCFNFGVSTRRAQVAQVASNIDFI